MGRFQQKENLTNSFIVKKSLRLNKVLDSRYKKSRIEKFLSLLCDINEFLVCFCTEKHEKSLRPFFGIAKLS